MKLYFSLFFIIFLLLDIFSIVKVYESVGFFNTFLLLVADVFIGAYLIKGVVRAKHSSNFQILTKRFFLRAIQGFLFAFPGFMSDFIALLLFVPFVNALIFVGLCLLVRLVARRQVGDNFEGMGSFNGQFFGQRFDQFFNQQPQGNEPKDPSPFYDSEYTQNKEEQVQSGLDKAKKVWASKNEIKEAKFEEIEDPKSDKKE